MAERDSSDGHCSGCTAEKREGCWICDPFNYLDGVRWLSTGVPHA